MNWLTSTLKGDRYIWMIVIALSVISLLAVYSSTGTLAYKYQAGNTEYYLLKHLGLMLFGLVIMYMAHLVNYTYYSRVAVILLWISVPLLLFTLLFGSDINEAKRWITLPIINITFQTSDLAKLALILYTARMLSKKQGEVQEFWTGFMPIIIPVALVCIIIAPADLSTAAVLFATCMLLMFIGRISLKYMFSLAGVAVAGLALLLLIAWAVPDAGRMGTWKNRIEAFMDGEQESYQAKQAKIAIAKGQVFGNGPGKSTQRNFLPHPYSDFIYAIIIEEYGLMGGGFLVFLYLLFLFRTIRIVMRSPKAFGAFMAVGLSLSLVLQGMVNMAVAVGLFPVTGLTLPLVSMGGTSLIFTSMAVGIILSVSRDVEELENPGYAAE
jgi:cell division protein FtsW